MSNNTNISSSFPIELNSIRSTSHVILVSLGLPLNILIAVCIVSFGRLRRKPRYIHWLGISSASILSLLTILLETVANHWKDNQLICKCFIASTGIGYTWLLFNLFLALADRYSAIVHSFWYRKNRVTVFRVVITQWTGLLLIVFIIKWPFISGQVTLTCAKVPQQSQVILILNVILMIACLIGQIVVYLKSKRFFVTPGESRSLSVSFTKKKKAPTDSASLSEEKVNIKADAGLRVHGGSRQMEIDATWLLLSGVLSLLLLTLPTLISGFIEWICSSLIYRTQCPNTTAATLYLRELLLFHLVYNPIYFLLRNGEFKTIFKDKWRLFNPPPHPVVIVQ